MCLHEDQVSLRTWSSCRIHSLCIGRPTSPASMDTHTAWEIERRPRVQQLAGPLHTDTRPHQVYNQLARPCLRIAAARETALTVTLLAPPPTPSRTCTERRVTAIFVYMRIARGRETRTFWRTLWQAPELCLLRDGTRQTVRYQVSNGWYIH